MTEQERLERFARCDRFLSGHGVQMPRRALAALAEEAGDAELGDVYGAGEAIAALEREVAALLGKPAALFLPSGTMAQQIALRIWAERRGCRTVAFHPTCHLELHEQRGYEHLHGLRARLLGERDRLLRSADLDAVSEPVAALLLELPQREIGGQLPPWAELLAQTQWARARGVALHLDGARLWETQPFYARAYADVTALFDSVYVSFYKILGGLAGAALLGDEAFVAEARIWLRRHGGNLVTQHPFVLSARLGLRQRLPRIGAYVARARELARLLAAIPSIRVLPDPPHTNMMHVALPGDAERLLDASARIAERDRVRLFTKLAPVSTPGAPIVEISVGDAALALGDAAIDAWFRELVAAG